MNRQFMEFWGNLFINTAKNQKQLEDMSTWVRQGMSSLDEMSTSMKKMYGLDLVAGPQPDDFKVWNKAIDDFKQLFVNGCLSIVGIKPFPGGHLDLIKKYEELKEKVVSQEETIKHLRLLLDEAKTASYTQSTLHIEELIQKQNEQFQTMMSGFGQFFKNDTASEESPQK